MCSTFVSVLPTPAAHLRRPRSGVSNREDTTAAAVKCSRLLAGDSRRKISPMSKLLATVLADALRLDEDARAELASQVLASLDGPAEPDAEQAWDKEIADRIAAIEAGTMPLEPWEAVRQRIEREILGR